MTTPTGLTNAEVAAYLNSVSDAAATPVLAALQALQTAVTAAQASLSGLPTSRLTQSVNNVVSMTNGYVMEFQTLQAQASPLTTSVGTIPALTVGDAATAFQPVTPAGGVGTLAYAISPAPPTGLTFSSTTGQISGTPTQASNASYTVTVTDQSMPAPQTSVANFSLPIAAAPG